LIRSIILLCVWSLDDSQILGGAFNLLQVIAAGNAAERMCFLMGFRQSVARQQLHARYNSDEAAL
jgi:hypothetical protein